MPGTLESLIVLLVFLVPGYVATVVFNRNAPRGAVSDVRFVLQIAFWGAVVQLCLLPLSGGYLLRATTEISNLLLTATPASVITDGLLLLGFPALVGFVARRLFDFSFAQRVLRSLGLSSRDSAPTAWDAAFTPGRPGAWLYVYVRGLPEPLVGEFGVGSIAGVSPYPHDLFLKKRYDLVDGEFVPVRQHHGVWISGDVIEYIEFLQSDDQKEAMSAKDRDKGDSPRQDRREGRGAKFEPESHR